MSGPQFRVTLTTTTTFVPYVAASVATLREHNRTVPVAVFVDEPSPLLDRLARKLDFDVHVVTVDPAEWSAVPARQTESVRSRIVKISSMFDAPTAQHLYLDSDTLVRTDIALMSKELGDRLGTEDDLFSLLNRPVAPTLWGDRRLYFTDPDISRTAVVELVHETFGVALPDSALDDMKCWNSGILLGSAPAMHELATRWLRHYRAMLPMAATGRIIPRDQLGFWLALWEMRETLRVREMPVRWNFMVGHLVPVPVGTESVDESAYAEAAILHLAQNKDDPWALRLVSNALQRTGTDRLIADAGVTVD
ncbi:hypothetical protein [Micromonospora sp. LOL_024]|uniref:hypothetical protein n=1 Tax=Micromonospora sp. LOL_024 TaxID=3345412 RepID=UPI003A8B48D8